MSMLVQVAIFLGASVVAVPVFKRLGLGAVLGYLMAGLVIGPWGLSLISDVENTLHFSELGVTLLLFVIGLELQPSRLWTLRRSVLGLGGSQVAASAVLLSLLGYWYGLSAKAAVVVGLALALSSTAFALQMLAERGQLTARHGRAAFAILLFQDLAVIPLLALIPLLGESLVGEFDTSLRKVVEVIVVVAGVIVGGRYLLRHVLRYVAGTGLQEVFTAMALLTVLGTALLLEHVGLSMALGAFLAGVLLADSEYRHALEADINPFKGLLLGLFFIAVGMSVNVGLIVQRPLEVVSMVVGLLALKAAVLYGLGRVYGQSHDTALNLSVALSQGGEFAFVLLGVAVTVNVLPSEVAELLIVVVTLSMALAPVLVLLREQVGKRWSRTQPLHAFDRSTKTEHPVIIAGFGRYGQMIGRVLRAKQIGFTALEISPEQVDVVRRFGNKIYYGDASRLDLLRAANAQRAEVFVLAVDDVEASLRIAQAVRTHFPNLTLYARARNRKHAYRLMDLGIVSIQRETFLSAVDTARHVLGHLGLSDIDSKRTVERFRDFDQRILFEHHRLHDDEQKYIDLTKRSAQELEELFARDQQEPPG